MSDTFLITGATGFIGSVLTRKLIEEEKKVVILSRNKKLNWRLQDITSRLTVYECDLVKDDSISILEKVKPDYIFHCAAYGSLPEENNKQMMIDVNVKGTTNLLNAVKKHPFKLFIYAGSSSEYGIYNQPIKETNALHPVNDYAKTKAEASTRCINEAIKNNLPIIIFRLFSPYGYYEDKNRLIPYVINQCISNKQLLLSNPKNVRDFIFIEDVVEAFIKATEAQHTPGDVVNIGSGIQHSIQEIVEAVLTITNSKSKIEWGAKEIQKRQQEPTSWVANILKAKRILNWEPYHTLNQGLEKTIDWFLKHKELYVD